MSFKRKVSEKIVNEILTLRSVIGPNGKHVFNFENIARCIQSKYKIKISGKAVAYWIQKHHPDDKEDRPGWVSGSNPYPVEVKLTSTEFMESLRKEGFSYKTSRDNTSKKFNINRNTIAYWYWKNIRRLQ